MLANLISQTIILIPLIALWKPFYVAFIFTAAIATEGLKALIAGPTWTLRPASATDCDLFCTDGRVGGAPGFPSGHMTITVLTVGLLWRDNPDVLWWGIPWIAAMAWARWQKGCHTPLQIVAGMVWGLILLQLIARSV